MQFKAFPPADHSPDGHSSQALVNLFQNCPGRHTPGGRGANTGLLTGALTGVLTGALTGALNGELPPSPPPPDIGIHSLLAVFGLYPVSQFVHLSAPFCDTEFDGHGLHSPSK